MLHLVEKELNLEVIELLKHTEMEIFQVHASNNEKLLQFDWKLKEESLGTRPHFFMKFSGLFKKKGQTVYPTHDDSSSCSIIIW